MAYLNRKILIKCFLEERNHFRRILLKILGRKKLSGQLSERQILPNKLTWIFIRKMYVNYLKSSSKILLKITSKSCDWMLSDISLKNSGIVAILLNLNYMNYYIGFIDYQNYIIKFYYLNNNF